MPEEHAKQIFLMALDRSDGTDREEFLNSACGVDTELRRRVNQLFLAHRENSFFLEPQLELSALLCNGSEYLSGTLIGPYKLLQKIGEGGMGVVYMAQQSEPIRRKVALKIIKPGMDTREVITRFEAERQAIGLMDHPNIARVLGGGVTATGRPYFVMDLVHGVSITCFCDENQLSTRERLELFIDVCRAVQHAHQKGIIHRDLKPSNVLVSMDDVRPIPKVIDFGVAKALSQHLTEKTMFTAFGQMIGSPLYMSPEQAQFSVQDVDTRSDIYSLGVLLYELLTGQTPFDRQALQNSGYEGMRKLICEVDPPRPSHRIATLNAATRTTIADQRKLDPRRLQQHLRSELDWIVMKALEKDRNRRYDSAGAFIQDIQRYLNGEPVLACPPSLAYRLSKTLRRHAELLVTVLLVIIALLVGLIMSQQQARRAVIAESSAIQQRDRALAAENNLRALLYAADIRRASDAWKTRDATRMREALLVHAPQEDQVDDRGFEWHYLWQQQQRLQREFVGEGDSVYFTLPLPTGELAVAGADGTLQFYDLLKGNLRRSVDPGQGELNGLALSPDGTQIATAGDDGTVSLYKLNSLELVWRVTAHHDLVFQLGFTPDGKTLVSGGDEPDARAWDVDSGRPIATLPTDGHSLETVVVGPDGKVALGTSWGGTWIYDRDFQTVLFHRPHSGSSVMQISRSGQFMAEGLNDGRVNVYRMDQLDSVLRLWKLPASVINLQFSSDDSLLAVGDTSGAVHLLPLAEQADEPETTSNGNATPQEPHHQSWQAHDGRLYALCFSPDGRELITGGQDGKVLAWMLSDQRFHQLDVTSARDILFNSSGELLATTAEGIHKLAGMNSGTQVPATEGEWERFVSLPGKPFLLATNHDDPAVFQISADLSTAQVYWPTTPESICRHLACSPDQRYLAVEVVPPAEHRLDPDSPAFIEIVDLSRKQTQVRIPSGREPGIRFLNDGTSLAFVRSKEIHIADIPTGKIRQTLSGHRTSVKSVDLDPSGRYLASVSGDRTLRLWDLTTGEEIWKTVAHGVAAYGLAFSPDGQTLATAGHDGFVRFWKWKVQRMALEIPVTRTPLMQVRFSPDGTQVALRSHGGNVWLLDARPTVDKSVQFPDVQKSTE